MIVTLTPNPAIDITYRVPELRPGHSHRVEAPRSRAGGKGVNTAGVLARMGVEHRCAALVAEEVAGRWDDDLRSRGVLPLTFAVPAPHRTRSTIAYVTDDGEATLLSEEGAAPPEPAWRDLAQQVLTDLWTGSSEAQRTPSGREVTIDARSPARGVLTISGSLPTPTPLPALLDLVTAALDAGSDVVIDGSGPWLSEALALGPTLVRPNASEAEQTLGIADPVKAARALVDRGAQAAMVSTGAEGAVLHTRAAGTWRARPGRRLHGNPTGAGDAATAAVAAYLSAHDPERDPGRWPELLRAAVAWSGAAVLAELAGDLDVDAVPGLADEVTIEQLAGAARRP